MARIDSQADLAPARFDIIEISANDLIEVEAFLHSQRAAVPPQCGAHSGTRSGDANLRWLLLDNPARRDDIPLGWQIRTGSGEILGAMLCLPQEFCIGDRRFSVLLSFDFYVDKRYRGAGLAVFLRYLHLGKRHALFVTTANLQSGALWQKFGGQAIPDMDHEMLGMWNVRPVIEEVLWRKSGSGLAARAAALPGWPLAQPFYRLKLPQTGELVRLTRAEEAFDLRIPPDPFYLSASFSPEYIRWRYFSPEAGAEVYRYRSASPGPGYFVAVKLMRRGYRRQLRVITVLDVRPKPDVRTLLSIAGCLAGVYRKEADAIVFRCLGLEEQEALAEAGLRRRPFVAPSGWSLDKGAQLPDAPWYRVPADGDMLV